MNNRNSINNNLDSLIERYFEGETSLEEEKLLKAMVARSDDSRYDAVRAVLGYGVATRKRTALRRRRLGMVSAAAVASIAVVSIAWLNLFTKNSTGNSECYAVVEGRYTSDQSEVLSIMQSDIGDIRSAQEDAGNYIAEQLKDIHISANE
ncbi:MAG: hypothetical protein PUB55_02640 [Bacteroidales bacterium]|nr:hypothetical protein [Bacteroidales bacterium]